MKSRLFIDTTTSLPFSTGLYSVTGSPAPHSSIYIKARDRTISSASTSSSLSVISPSTSSTNASATSLLIPPPRHPSPSRSRSASPDIDETVRLGPEYVLAMHDYTPQSGNATCLAFRAGQVIQVHNRDTSGWWDGELEGRRGWFPSNYVNAELVSLTEEEEPAEFRLHSRRGHRYSHSQSSTTSWTTISSSNHSRRNRSLSLSRPSEDEADPYCPPLMIPLLHGLSLLQNAVRSNRLAHFQPSTACIISCVRSILASTGTLQREAPILQNFTSLSDERRRILTVLASLVAQAKRASEGNLEGEAQETEVENMLRLGGQVFSHVRAFLAVAVECGVELLDQDAPTTATIASATPQIVLASDEDDDDSPTKTPTQHRGQNSQPVPRPGLRIGGPRSREHHAESGSPNLVKTLARARQEQYLLGERTPGKHKNGASISSLSSSSSISSQQSVQSSPPPFPCGPSSAAQVLEALRHTHDHYLSTIAAFIGHVHTHSRSSHASSTGVLYDLVKEIVEMVCKLLTIVEAVMQYPDVPVNRVGNLKQAKEGLYDVTSSLAESVRLLTVSLPSSMSEEAEKQVLLRSATGAVQAGADCVAAVKVCLTRATSDRPFIVNLPSVDRVMTRPLTPAVPSPPDHEPFGVNSYHFSGTDDEDHTIQPQTSSPTLRSRQISSGSDNSSVSNTSFGQSDETRATSPDTVKSISLSLPTSHAPSVSDLPSPTSVTHTDEDGFTLEGSSRGHQTMRGLEESIVQGEVPPPPLGPIPEYIQDLTSWMFGHDYNLEDIAYNSEGHLVGATMDVLVEKMTPHDSIVDPAFSAVFFLTFRLFSSPLALVDGLISRYNLMPPQGISNEDLHLWQQKKGIPVRLRVSNFIKLWVELYWRSGVDDVALIPLTNFTREGLAIFFQGPAHRILDLLNMRRKSSDLTISPQLGERARDPGMSINPPTATTPTSEIPRPLMTKTLLASLRKKDFSVISVTEFDHLELSRQLTIMECHLYCLIQPEEILETGQEGATPPLNVKSVTSLSTVITGWAAESILDEPDLKKRTALVKFFIKIADRCASLNNFSTTRSVLAALDSSVISRLRQTWAGLPQKHKLLLDTLRKLAEHGRNYHEYRSRLRNTAPPAVPFLGLYLTDVTFCREGNPSLRASPLNANKKLINFNKYHKLARIVQDMQRFQVPYTLKAIPEVQDYLQAAFEKCKHHGDLEDLYRRSLLVEPKQPADAPQAMGNDMRQLFSWATRSTQAS